MIQEAYVSYEIAKLLKKKGFDEPTLAFYIPFEDGEVKFRIGSVETYFNTLENYPWMVSAPTQQMACAWLREKHLIHIYAEYKAFFQEKPKKVYYHWMPFVRTLPNCPIYNSGFPNYLDIYCDSHEEAIEAALKYTLENLLK